MDYSLIILRCSMLDLRGKGTGQGFECALCVCKRE